MSLRTYQIVAATLAGMIGPMCLPAAAVPVPCAGGTLDFTVSSDTPLTLPVLNVGQQVILAAVVSGFTAASFAWTIPGPHIKDYSEDLGTKLGPAASPLPWSTTSLTSADLAAASVAFYWKPSPVQIHPMNGPPEPRNVSLTVTPTAGGPCTSSQTLMVERNATDSDRQPEDFYTSNHRSPTTTNPGFGRVVDEHIYWHQVVGGGPTGSWWQFLPWHTAFLTRFDQWRAEFGYPAVAPWYPGRPLPTGPAFDHTPSLRLSFNPDANRVPTYFTLAGGTPADFLGQTRLADYTDLNVFSDSFEGSYHGDVHCNIGTATGGFFATSGPGFGSMCKASSPKDPMFWRWHGFIDVLYRNFCQLKGIACHAPTEPASDPWMGDNAADIAAGGVVPSPAPRWLSPDIWNRRAPVNTDGCIPRDPPPNLNTVGGVTRDCGSDADHENPVAGSTNFLYATLRNDGRGGTRTVYAEVAVYVANASTGLAWPTDFTMLLESRQFITLHLEPGQVTDIGPLPWTPPSPVPSDHWCLYIRVLTVQEAPASEGANVDANVEGSNSIAWRNLKIVNPGDEDQAMRFIVRNIRQGAEDLGLEFLVTPELFGDGKLTLRLDDVLKGAAGEATLSGIERLEDGLFLIGEPKASLSGLRLRERQQGTATLQFEGTSPGGGEVQVTQFSANGVDGGSTLRLAGKK